MAGLSAFFFTICNFKQRPLKILLIALLLSTFISYMYAQTPAGTVLLPVQINQFQPYGPGISNAMISPVAAANQPFAQALQINTYNRPSPNADYGLRAGITTPLHKGDVLWISFKARSLESKRESGESLLELRFDKLVNGRYTWPSHLERSISIGANWTETSIPFIMKMDAMPEDLLLIIKFDTYAQRFELGPLTFINCGQQVKLTDLPKTTVHYEGDAPDAPWRKAAAARIDKYRKGNLSVRVTDAAGKPVNGAAVSVKMTKSAYAWGTATNSGNILDTTDPALKKYRDTLLRYFNKIVFENEMKSGNWAKTDHRKTIKANAWLNAHHITARGHVMVWPSWQHSPHLLPFQHDSAALYAEILRLINDETTVMRGQFVEWDVVNEPFAQHNIMDSLGGKKVMVDWFNAARKNTPGVKLFLNDFSMFHTSGGGSDSFYNNVKYLLDHGAPVDGIGEQSHIGGTPPGMTYILDKLDKFAAFGLPIQISEFDITSDDDDFKARYLRDYFTALFSHPATIGILQWGFWESSHWLPAAALWNKDWSIRPEGKVFAGLVSKTWATNEDGLTGKDGNYSIRGYTGDYTITVTYENKKVTKQITLDNTGKIAVLQLYN